MLFFLWLIFALLFTFSFSVVLSSVLSLCVVNVSLL